jgi:IS605 OrfB family transposase
VPCAGEQESRAFQTARLTRFFDHTCDPIRVRAAYRCRAYPDEAQQQVLARTFGCVRVVWNRPLAARRARYAADGAGTSYAETDRALTAMKRDPELAFLTEVSCVDLGVTNFAVTSAGEKIPNPRHLERRARSLARYQRRLARCQQGSANRAKAAAKMARAHRKVRHARADFLHKASTRLVRQNDMIVIEDLNVRGMVRNRHLARAISGCGWGEFRRQLAYKCQRYGRQLAYKCQRYGRRLVVIDHWYPSTKTCSAYGYLLVQLSLGTRHWRCPSCGARHDRDVNAAKNILAAGRAVARGSPGDACGAEVRHSGSSRVRSAAKQEPRPATAGISVPQTGSSQGFLATPQ